MTVHGLTQRMTAMAAREAALGAGAVVKYQTAGRLRDHDLREIEAVQPEPDPARRRGRGRRLRHRALQRRAPGELEARPIVVYAGNSRGVQRRPGAAGAGRLQGQAHQQRLSGRRRARHRAGPRRHPRRVRGAHHARARHGAHRRGRERQHPADARARC